ncbi:MAG: ECF transporter S component [Candidatus Heimdallarchaeota archaeon]
MKRYSTFDLIMIAVLAALGLGTKQIVRPVIEIFTRILVIPGGAIAGGFYMLWLVLAKRFVPKFGSGIFFGIVQALVVLILPFGSHGIFTFITYSLPGLAIDIIELLNRKNKNAFLFSVIDGAAANVIGSVAVSIFIFDMPIEILLFVMLLAILSGNIGGVIAYLIMKQIQGPLLQTAIIESDISTPNQEQITEETTIIE